MLSWFQDVSGRVYNHVWRLVWLVDGWKIATTNSQAFFCRDSTCFWWRRELYTPLKCHMEPENQPLEKNKNRKFYLKLSFLGSIRSTLGGVLHTVTTQGSLLAPRSRTLWRRSKPWHLGIFWGVPPSPSNGGIHEGLGWDALLKIW